MGKRAKPEESIAKLRAVEVRMSQGDRASLAVRSIGVTEQTYYRWRKAYGGLQVDQAKRMKEMEKENARLRRAVSDLTVDNQILKEVAREIFYTLKEAQILIEKWRNYYNKQRPHSSLGCRPPAPQTILPASHMLP